MIRSDTAIYTAYDEHEAQDAAGNEKQLMLAVLNSAVSDLGRRGEAYRAARRFFLSQEEEYVFAFRSICRELDLCPFKILRNLGLFQQEDIYQRVAF